MLIDIDKITGEKPQLQVAPITNVKTEHKLQFLRQIAVNSQYICYGLKQGHIRVLNKASALRALFKSDGATPTNLVADMAFFSPTSNVLASIDTSGQLTVRKVLEQGEEEVQASSDPTIEQEVLCRHSLGPVPSELSSRRLAWHPTLDSLLAVTQGDRVSLVNIPPSAGLSGSPEFAAPSSPSSSLFTPNSNAFITSLAFNDRGDLLAASDSEGYVHIWLVDEATIQASGNLPPLSSDPDVKFRALDPNGPISSIDFMPSRPSGVGGGKAVLVVGNATCNIVRLWSVDVERPPSCLHTLELSSASSFFNHMAVQPRLNAVVLANTRSRQVYVAHVTHKGEARFDCLMDFVVTQPILSLATTPECSYEDGEEVFYLFTVQTESIQQYTLPPFDVGGGTDEVVEVEAEVVEDNGTCLAIQSKQRPLSNSSGSSATSPYRPMLTDEEVKGHQASIISPLSITGLREVDSKPLEIEGGDDLEDEEGPSESGSCASPSPYPPPPLPSPTLFAAFASSKAEASKAVASTTRVSAKDRGSPSPPPPPSSLLVKKLSSSPSPNQVQGLSQAPALSASNIGAQLLMAQGWEPGTGLGRDKQGIVEPIAPVMRKQGSGLGYSKEKKGKAAEVEEGGGELDDESPLVPEADEGAGEGEGESSVAAPSALPPAPLDGPFDGSFTALSKQVSKLSERNSVLFNQLRAELAKTAKSSEASIARAVEAALARQSRQMEQERAKEAKKLLEAVDVAIKRSAAEARKDTQEDAAKLLAVAVNNLSSKISEAARNTLASIPGAVDRAVAESLPLTMASGPGQQALQKVLTGLLPRIVGEQFKTNLVPAVEGAAREMFSQMDAAFTSGLAGHFDAAKASHKDLTASIQSLVTEAKSSVQQIQSAAGLFKQSQGANGGGGGPRGGVNLAELERRTNPKVVISDLLSQLKYGEAFTAALNTQDPSVTLWLCKTLDRPSVVFDLDPIPMGQEVFLSLATHLAHDLGGASDSSDSSNLLFKLHWLQECVSAIVPSDSKIGGHCKAVLEPIKGQLAAIARGGGGEVAKVAKTCLHLVNSIIMVAGR